VHEALFFLLVFRFGGMQDRFDLIIPPGKRGNISMGSIGLVPISDLGNMWTVIVRKGRRRGIREKNLQN
jgi:hypothetical protein